MKARAPLLLGVDIGTSGSRGSLLNSEGETVAEHRIEYRVLTPRPGWTEQAPERDWWRNFVAIVKTLLTKTGIDSDAIVAVGVDGVCPILCPVDKHGRTIRNAILYSDLRASQYARLVEKSLGAKKILKISGNRMYPQSGTAKLLWFKRSEPRFFRQTHKIFIGAHNYVVFKLTGATVTDPGTATHLPGIFDIDKDAYDEESCEILGVDSSLLPTLMRPYKVAGELSADASRKTGLRKGTAVIVGTSDANASALASGATREGDAVLNYGSTAVISALTASRSSNPALFLQPYLLDRPLYIVKGVTATSGVLLTWFAKNVLGSERSDALKRLDAEAARIAPGSQGLLLLPYFMGERAPLYDPDALGALLGLTLSHTRAHIYRAILEGVSYSIRHIFGLMVEQGIAPARLKCTGGVSKSRIAMQIMADVLRIPIVPVDDGRASVGAGFLSGIGIGLHSSFDQIRRRVREAQTVSPKAKHVKVYEQLFDVYLESYPALRQTFKHLRSCCKMIYPHD